jgi:hypothetical protein
MSGNKEHRWTARNSQTSSYSTTVAASGLQAVIDDLEACDKLPQPLRRVLHALATSFSGMDTLKYSKQYQVQQVANEILAVERREIFRFGEFDYKKETGSEYPFIAARISVQRYGSGVYRPPKKIAHRKMLSLTEDAFVSVPALHRALRIR